MPTPPRLAPSIAVAILAGASAAQPPIILPAPAETSASLRADRALGADFCADAHPISGLGQFQFDSTFATTDGPEHLFCSFFGSLQITTDVWFRWTATCTGTVTISTCSLAGFDTKMAVYAPLTTCPPADQYLLDCDDAACGQNAALVFDAIAGQTYLLRVGSFSPFPGGQGIGGQGRFVITCDGEEVAPCEGGTECREPLLSNALASTAGVARAADRIVPAFDASITGICFHGLYAESLSPTGPQPDRFAVSYYTETAGRPGTLIARFTEDDGLAFYLRRRTDDLVGGEFPSWEYAARHLPVPVSAGTPLWVEVTNELPAGPFLWFWQDGAGPDSSSLQDTTPADGYANAVPAARDRAFCLLVETCAADADNDGVVGFSDLNAVLAAFGFACEDGQSGARISLPSPPSP